MKISAAQWWVWRITRPARTSKRDPHHRVVGGRHRLAPQRLVGPVVDDLLGRGDEEEREEDAGEDQEHEAYSAISPSMNDQWSGKTFVRLRRDERASVSSRSSTPAHERSDDHVGMSQKLGPDGLGEVAGRARKPSSSTSIGSWGSARGGRSVDGLGAVQHVERRLVARAAQLVRRRPGTGPAGTRRACRSSSTRRSPRVRRRAARSRSCSCAGSTRISTAWASAEPTNPSGKTVVNAPTSSVSRVTGGRRPIVTRRGPGRQVVSASSCPARRPATGSGTAPRARGPPAAASSSRERKRRRRISSTPIHASTAASIACCVAGASWRRGWVSSRIRGISRVAHSDQADAEAAERQEQQRALGLGCPPADVHAEQAEGGRRSLTTNAIATSRSARFTPSVPVSADHQAGSGPRPIDHGDQALRDRADAPELEAAALAVVAEPQQVRAPPSPAPPARSVARSEHGHQPGPDADRLDDLRGGRLDERRGDLPPPIESPARAGAVTAGAVVEEQLRAALRARPAAGSTSGIGWTAGRRPADVGDERGDLLGGVRRLAGAAGWSPGLASGMRPVRQ